MRKDKNKTDVQFFIERDNENSYETPLALFINESADNRGNKSCYSHVGQHSICSPDYIRRCRKATPDEYKELLEELESIGYNLNIIN